jgi:hypothetical protein
MEIHSLCRALGCDGTVGFSDHPTDGLGLAGWCSHCGAGWRLLAGLVLPYGGRPRVDLRDLARVIVLEDHRSARRR